MEYVADTKHAKQSAPRLFVGLPGCFEIQSHVNHWLIAIGAIVSGVSVFSFEVRQPDTEFQFAPFKTRLVRPEAVEFDVSETTPPNGQPIGDWRLLECLSACKACEMGLVRTINGVSAHGASCWLGDERRR